MNTRVGEWRDVVRGLALVGLSGFLAAGLLASAALADTDPLHEQRAATAFVPNQGQWPESVLFRARSGALTSWFVADGWWIDARRVSPAAEGAGRVKQVRGSALRLRFEGASPSVRVSSEGAVGGRRNYFIGSDPDGWARDVPAFESLRYEELYPGVDLLWRTGETGLEYDLLLAADADPDALSTVIIHVSGAEGLELAADGSLRMHTPFGPVLQTPPRSWSVAADGSRRALTSGFRLLGVDRYGLEVEGHLPGEALVIDPGLVWSTFLGDTDLDEAFDVALLSTGEVLVAGVTWTPSFPVTPGAYDELANGFADAFLCKLKKDGSGLVYSTFLGGSLYDFAVALVVDGAGNVTLTGNTESDDFPTTAGAYDTTHGGFSDVFVARLDASGGLLTYSTLLGDDSTDRARAIGLFPDGSVVVAGSTNSAGFPTTPGAFDRTYGGGLFAGDGFITRLDPAGAGLVYSTFLGGTKDDAVACLDVGADERVTVGGSTSSFAFPTTSGAFDTTISDFTGFAVDGFVTRLSASGSSLSFSTYFGGNGLDVVQDVKVGGDGTTTLCGATESTNFPVTYGTAYDPSYNGNGDAFVSRLDASGGALVFSTYLGSDGNEAAEALDFDSSGNIVVVGCTTSTTFPVTARAYDLEFGNTVFGASQGPDAFVTRLSAAGTDLLYSTFLGGTIEDSARAVVVDATDTAVIVGSTSSQDFPTTPGVFDPAYDQSFIPDAFVTRLDFALYPQAYGQAKQNSYNNYPLLYYGGFPSVSGSFFLGLAAGIINQPCWVVYGPTQLDLPFFGGTLLVSPPSQRIGPITLSFLGDFYVPVQMDRSFIGQTIYYQAWFKDPGDSFGVGLSNGLEVLFHL